MAAIEGVWKSPPWDAPLDADVALRAIPNDATITGVFVEAVAGLARDRGVSPASARAKYTSFQAYPLREHCTLLVEVCRLAFPDLPLRIALRKLGRGAPHALVRTTIGRVVFGSVEGPLEIIRAMAKSYAMHMRPSSLVVEAEGQNACLVHVSEVYNFLDSHNVGVFEGVLHYAKVEGSVRIRSYSRTAADLYCEWK